MRALSIASHLQNARVTLLGSGLRAYQHLIPEHIHCIHLPSDVAEAGDRYASMNELSFLHYAPMNVQKVASRAAAITTALETLFPAMLVVDVSVEVTLLATLCGTPTVVIRQNGDRHDTAHLHAYECAQLLIAPSPEVLMNPSPHDWVNEKTFFSGGFSKYSGRQLHGLVADPEAVGVMVGSGGTSVDAAVVQALAVQCPDKTIHVIGDIQQHGAAENVVFHGKIDDPAAVLTQCSVVIGNAGHNTVMEMADLGKKFVCIPEERPFAEQVRKAELLEKHRMAVVVAPEVLPNANWKSIIARAEQLGENCWQGVISETALADIAQQLHHLWENNFA